MISPIVIVVFVGTFLFAAGLVYAFSGESADVSDRLGRLWRPAATEKMGVRQSTEEFAGKVLSGIAKYVPSKAEQPAEGESRLIQAGFRRPEAASAFAAAKVVSIVALLGLVYLTGLYES